ncbi:hypothetical protein ES288_D13G007500v1 [Gossypium darwinii]|uniref:DUF7804 domain-containing protein n=1 Tax=Gossypium darwinii TaxID=34276 RepID=A0A5D1ZVS1_GOSDA|nr:hypothetical protein ES288_D13G007500v1 [Gossypium darwinii]
MPVLILFQIQWKLRKANVLIYLRIYQSDIIRPILKTLFLLFHFALRKSITSEPERATMAVVCSVGCGCGSVSFQRCESLMLSNPTSSKPRTSKIFATTPPPSSKPVGGGSLQSLQPERSSSKNKRKGIPYEKMDGWMRDSVAEIVKKLPESPLLIHVYSEDATMETTAVEENWVSMKQKWKKGERAMPDGVIFVDQIQAVEEGTWGIVVQSKSEEEDDGCGSGPGSEPVPPACYLLKTTSEVGSGLGLRCTHFCLVKVSSFRESAFSQLKNCWLLQGN